MRPAGAAGMALPTCTPTYNIGAGVKCPDRACAVGARGHCSGGIEGHGGNDAEGTLVYLTCASALSSRQVSSYFHLQPSSPPLSLSACVSVICHTGLASPASVWLIDSVWMWH